MKICLASDHTGLPLKAKIKNFLLEKGYVVEDCGALTLDKDDDYPDFIAKAAEQVSKDPEQVNGIIMGGSGQGEAIVANKFKHVRCALFYAPCIPAQSVDITGKESSDPFEMLKLTKIHNNTNMLSLGVRFLTEKDALKAVEIWTETQFPSEERHTRRVEKIKKIEQALYR